jgi:serine/threonine protein kinase
MCSEAEGADAMKQLCPNPKCGAENALNDHDCPRCGTPQRQLLARGTILRGRYRIEAVRGCGGFGAVYRATDLQTSQTVAIKENQRHQTFQRFEREGKLLIQLSHPNLPTVHEVFVDQTTGRAFLVMDFIDGETLEEMLERLQRPLTWQEAQPILAQVINALNHLHRNKIIHRDISPSNIIVTKRYETVYSEMDDWEEVTVPPPKLNEDHIAKLTDDRRFEQGMNYWRDGWRLENPQRDGWTLTGNCWGDLNPVTRDQRYYHLTVTLTPKGISGQKCTCSDFRGRRLCKHLVALLLAWVHEPQKFKVVAEKKERRHVKRRVPRRVERQWVMLVDFGVAKVMEEVDPQRSRPSSIVVWKDGYSPPEQYASGCQIDARADQYALAATMVFVLTGTTPDDALTRMKKFREGEPTLPPKPDGVPESVWKAIEVAMRFEPSQRFGSVTDFWEAVQGHRKSPVEHMATNLRTSIEPSLVRQAISGAVTGAILLTIFGAIGGTIVGALLSAIGIASEGILTGAIVGAILTAVFGAIGKWLALTGAVGGAIVGAILSVIGIKLKEAIGGALVGAILSAILGAIGGAIEGIENRR